MPSLSLIHIYLVYQYPLVHLLDEAFEMLEFAQDRGAHIACDSGMYTHFAAPLGSATFDLDNMEICDWKFDELLVSTGPHKGEWMTESLYRKLRREAPGTEIVCFSGEDDAIAHAFTRDYVMPVSYTHLDRRRLRAGARERRRGARAGDPAGADLDDFS